MAITREQVLHVARLARLDLGEDEVERLQEQLSAILEAVSKVSELDLTLYRTGFLFFQQLSKNFEFYSGALDYMRKAYFAPQSGGESPFAVFLRQVEGWITDGLSDN